MSSRRQDDQGRRDDARDLEDMMLAVRSRKEGNQYCADCGVPSPEYVNLTIGSFICEVCADIHRSTSKRQVKDIFAGPLSLADIRRMEDVGNDKANRRFLATWNPDEIPQPDRADRQLLKEFLWLKYEGSFKKPTQPAPPRAQQASRYSSADRVSSQREAETYQNPSSSSDHGAHRAPSQPSYWASRFAPPPRPPQPPERSSNSMDDYFSRRVSNSQLDSAYRSTVPANSDRFQPPLHPSRPAYPRQSPNPPPLPPQSRRPMYPPYPPPPSHSPYDRADYDYRHPWPQQASYPYPDEDPHGHHQPYAPVSPSYDQYDHAERDPRRDGSPRRLKQKSKKKDKNASNDWDDTDHRRGNHDVDDEDDFDEDTASGSASSRRGRKILSTSKKSSKAKAKDSVSKSVKSLSVRESKETKTKSKRRPVKYDDDSDTDSDDEIVIQAKKKSSKKKCSNTSDRDAGSVESTSADGLDTAEENGKSNEMNPTKTEYDLMSEWMGDSKETDGSAGKSASASSANLNGTLLPNMMPPQGMPPRGMPLPSAYQTVAPMPMMPMNMYGTVVPGLMPPFGPQGAPFLPGMSMHPNMGPMPGLMAGMQGLAINPASAHPNFPAPVPPPMPNQQRTSLPPPPPLGMPAGPPPGPPPGGPPNE